MLPLYGLARGLASTLRFWASYRHDRAKRRYEQLKQRFDRAERDCKAGEVSVGRPMDYAAQLQLLKLFEAVEAARLLWVRRANTLNARTRIGERIAAFQGRKLPYSLGLIDMALVMRVLDYFGPRVEVTQLADWALSLLR